MSTQLKDGPRFSSVTQAGRLFFAAPWLFVVFQLPQATNEILETLFVPENPKKIPWQIFALLPIFCISNILSTSMTFASVQQIFAGEKPSLKLAWEQIKARAWLLIFSSVVVGLVILLGLALFLLPGLYYTAIYLFVPYLILSQPAAPLSAFLNQSKKLAKRHLWTCLGFAALGLGLNFLQIGLGNIDFSSFFFTGQNETFRNWLNLGVQIIFAMFAGLVMDVWISAYFLTLKKRGID